MGKSLAYSNSLLKLILQGTAFTGLAINATVAPLTNLYVALHTADPGEDGDQETSEAAYPGYARVAVPRSALGFSVVANVAKFFNNVAFPTATGGNESELYFSIGTDDDGPGEILYSGALADPIVVTLNVTPVLDGRLGAEPVTVTEE